MTNLLALIALLLLGSAYFTYRFISNGNTSAKDWYEANANEAPLVELPKDDAPHETGMEKWRYNDHLRTPEGHVLSYYYAMFVVDGFVKNTMSLPAILILRH
jgi:predicted secreted hydrolase